MRIKKEMLLKIKCNKIFIIRNLTVRVRFAPSPTGMMHIGGLRIAFYNYLFAKKHNGLFLLRIEDTDRQRFKPDSVDNIISSLKWTNLIPDHGVGFSRDKNEEKEYFQSNRLNYYKLFVQKLLDKNLAYKCFCSEMRLELLKKNAIKNEEKQSYDGKCRNLSQKDKNEFSNKPFVVRFKLEKETIKFNDLIYGDCAYNLHEQEGDFVLMKSDGYPTYHFANIVDDHLMGISHVLRGQEWLTSTPKHLMLYKALDLQPPKYAHFPLILNPDGSKLSKRNNDIDVMSFKNRGIIPDALCSYLTTFGGGFKIEEGEKNSTKILSELINLFDLNFITKRPIKFNEETLLSINKEVLVKKIQSKDKSLIIDLRSLLSKKNIDPYYLTDAYLEFALNLTLHRISKLLDLLSDDYQYLWHNNDRVVFKNEIQEKLGIEKEQIITLIDELILFLDKYKLSIKTEDSAVKLKEELNNHFKLIKKKLNLTDSKDQKLNLWFFYRLILSGKLSGPPIAEIITLLGKENILHRLNNTKKMFEI
jgi:glutamyl-tRNA synthetase